MKHPTDVQGTGFSLPVHLHLPVALLSQYLFFLTRRPISSSNVHYLESRLRGLKSLAPHLRSSGIPTLVQIADRLEALHPASFRRLGPGVQLALVPLANANRTIPGDVVVQDGPPPAEWTADLERVLLVLGPGIGIGDELMFFSLPRWLKDRQPKTRVTVLTGYRGIWDTVEAVDHVEVYADHRSVLAALQGEDPHAGYDLVILGDFEHPGLHPAIASDGRLERYLELSLGSRSAFLVDNRHRWLYRIHHVTPYFENFYTGLGHVLRSLGIAANEQDRFGGEVVRREQRPPADSLQVFVSPFTSKYEPSEPYWSHLVANLLPSDLPGPARIVLDTGKNARTERFAAGLQRSVSARLTKNVDVQLAPADRGRNLSLPGVFRLLESCHVALCADSFAAHAAPLYGCLTLVVARAGLEPWRVPHQRSFYLAAEDSVHDAAAAARLLLGDLLAPVATTTRLARTSQAEDRLATLTAELSSKFDSDSSIDLVEIAADYEEFGTLLAAVGAEVDRWPAAKQTLFRDPVLAEPVRALSAQDTTPAAHPAARLHLQDHLQRWQYSNLCKYLLAARDEPPDFEPRLRAPEDQPGTSSAPSKSVSVGPPIGQRTSGAMVDAVRAVAREQLPTGEIATHFQLIDSGLEYVQSPLCSTFVHDALAPFDLSSPWVAPHLFDQLPNPERVALARTAAEVRRRIRQFLAWMERNDATWRFRGRAPGRPADLDTTACAAVAMLQAPRRGFAQTQDRHAAALQHLRAIHEPLDPATAANVLRGLVLVGAQPESIERQRSALLDDLDGHGLDGASRRYPDPLARAYCIARAWRQGRLPGLKRLRECLVSEIFAHGRKADGRPLTIALGLHALLDLRYDGPEVAAAREALFANVLPRGGWVYGPLLSQGGGAPACTTALAISALARSVGHAAREAA